MNFIKGVQTLSLISVAPCIWSQCNVCSHHCLRFVCEEMSLNPHWTTAADVRWWWKLFCCLTQTHRCIRGSEPHVFWLWSLWDCVSKEGKLRSDSLLVWLERGRSGEGQAQRGLCVIHHYATWMIYVGGTSASWPRQQRGSRVKESKMIWLIYWHLCAFHIQHGRVKLMWRPFYIST